MTILKQVLLVAFDKLAYLAFSVLGFYFIYEGNVLQRFNSKKTFFAEYDEPVNEFPTIYTMIDGPMKGHLEYGKDFNISFRAQKSVKKIPGERDRLKRENLTIGKNILVDSPLEVTFEPIWDGTVFRISPLNYEQRIPLAYELEFTSSNTTGISSVGLQLITETGGSIDFETFDTNDVIYKGSLGKTV